MASRVRRTASAEAGANVLRPPVARRPPDPKTFWFQNVLAPAKPVSMGSRQWPQSGTERRRGARGGPTLDAVVILRQLMHVPGSMLEAMLAVPAQKGRMRAVPLCQGAEQATGGVDQAPDPLDVVHMPEDRNLKLIGKAEQSTVDSGCGCISGWIPAFAGKEPVGKRAPASQSASLLPPAGEGGAERRMRGAACTGCPFPRPPLHRIPLPLPSPMTIGAQPGVSPTHQWLRLYLRLGTGRTLSRPSAPPGETRDLDP